ncbi:glucans biosynthesis glucosyltransferase MdoH [Segnochrobactrum spirostomi]|uniref:Glucans biosynthesis glucosyltransferase H n=1 Tax=Segnochrobactrum spirostomi TaxID=2608987 RepID=A0A6A7Y540_9HYPH|nr:glucans biosynthesis glucosyltransferase MdoH [Segnochrobactrum spirostomi]MQT13835.1 glucans biosynthesis glucosyltransferase MdoH [Segnochrobactrum spirostomi]
MDGVRLRLERAGEADGLVPRLADFRALPDEAPLSMPVQSLRSEARARPLGPNAIAGRRLLVLGAAFAVCVAGAFGMYEVLVVGGLTVLEDVVLVLYVLLFGWIALSVASAVGGFLAIVAGSNRLGIDPAAPLPPLASRTALLMPTYNEDPARVFAALQAMHEEIAAAGRLDAFDFFILSDTTDPAVWLAEEAAFLRLRAEVESRGREQVFYRRRRDNTERKAGNIAEWVQRFGGAYDHMLILDADSIMTADAVVRLAEAMERHPTAALIQTLPVLVSGRTLFARLQQFAGRVYGPLIAQGIAWWHGPDGNYWGHNAIIRVAPFAAHAGLPHIEGRKPFGGHIMSHDFVEAALMRRAGWSIHMVPGLPGSYEESPPSLIDFAARDRRWCQGNLQHLAVLPARGLHWVSRIHFLVGVGAYLSAPLWLLFLAVGMALALQARFVPPDYFSKDFSLFPTWPAQDPVLAAWMFAATMGCLVLPKFMGLALVIGRERRAFGGAFATLAGVVVEIVLSALVAPIMMLLQSAAVVDILIGRDAGWSAQRRDDGRVPFGAIARRHAMHTLVGLATAVASYLIALPLFLWMLPVTLGLILSIPLSAWTGSRWAGQGIGRLGLLRTPEERAPPPVLLRVAELQALYAETGTPSDPIARLAGDPALAAAHLAMLPPPSWRRGPAIRTDLLAGFVKLAEAATLAEAERALDAKELAAVLADPDGFAALIAAARRAQIFDVPPTSMVPTSARRPSSGSPRDAALAVTAS